MTFTEASKVFKEESKSLPIAGLYLAVQNAKSSRARARITRRMGILTVSMFKERNKKKRNCSINKIKIKRKMVWGRQVGWVPRRRRETARKKGISQQV